jgi:hypothetical protein
MTWEIGWQENWQKKSEDFGKCDLIKGGGETIRLYYREVASSDRLIAIMKPRICLIQGEL